MTPNYRRLAQIAHEMRIIASTLENAAQKGDGQAVFIAYCDVIICHEKIRDIVAGRKID